MVAATQSRTTYRPSKLTVRHVCQRLSHERQGARLCLCQPQTDPMKNIGLATDTTVRLVRKRLQIEIQRQLLDRFKRSDRDSLIHSASIKVFNGCKIGTRAMGDNQACMVRYRYEPADGSIQMVDLPGIGHLYMSANHQEDVQPPACVRLVLIEWLKYDNRIDHTRGGCHIIKDFQSRELHQFADPDMSGPRCASTSDCTGYARD